MSELDKIINGDQKETEHQPSDDSESDDKKKEQELLDAQTKLDEETQKKEEHLANVNKAIAEANEKLRKARKGGSEKSEDEEDEIPNIDYDDPSAKAWKREIRKDTQPLQDEMEKEKEEVRSASLQEFLMSKPALAKDPKKVEVLMDEYERLSKGKITERQKDGVKIYLQKAYASLYHDELTRAATDRRFNEAQAEIELADVATDKGATTYHRERSTSDEALSPEDVAAITRMYGSVEEYRKTLKEVKPQ